MISPECINVSWWPALKQEFSQPYMQKLTAFLTQQTRAGKVVFPAEGDWFNAFNCTPFDNVKVVLIGQDPYHGPGQAHGLCFSVLPGVKLPPSLVNIYKELAADLAVSPVDHGCLINWAQRGVLMLNTTLTVEQAKAGSHQGKGWERFTDRAIEELSRQREGLVFLLWGGQAQKKVTLIDQAKHLVLSAPHPSPLSAYRGFLGCCHFSRANQYLLSQGAEPVNWVLSSRAEVEKLLS